MGKENYDLGKTIGRIEADVNGLKTDVKEMKEDFKDFRTYVESKLDGIVGKPPTLWRIGLFLASGVAAGFGIDKFF